MQGQRGLGGGDEEIHPVGPQPPQGAGGALRHLDAEAGAAGQLLGRTAPLGQLRRGREHQRPPSLAHPRQHPGERRRGVGRPRRRPVAVDARRRRQRREEVVGG